MASKIVLLVSLCALARSFSDPYHPVVEEIIYDYEVSDGHPIPYEPHPIHPIHPNLPLGGHPIQPVNGHPIQPVNGHPNVGVNLDIKIPGVDQWKGHGVDQWKGPGVDQGKGPGVDQGKGPGDGGATNGKPINFGGAGSSKSPLEHTQYFPVELCQCVGVPTAYECIKKNSGNCDMSTQDCLCKHMGNIYDKCFGGEKLTGATCQLDILRTRDQARQNATSLCKLKGLSAGIRSNVNEPALVFTLFGLIAFALI